MTLVMIVDDEEDIRLLTRLILEAAGYDVIEADGAMEALDRLDSTTVDLMVLDIRMSGMDGWELMGVLADMGYLPGLRILAFSAHVEPAVLQGALDRGCVGVLVKPFTREECLGAIRTALAYPSPYPSA